MKVLNIKDQTMSISFSRYDCTYSITCWFHFSSRSRYTLKDVLPNRVKQRQDFVNNYIFFVLNQIFVQLAGIATIKGFLDYLGHYEIIDWPEQLAKRLSLNGSFFLRYLIQVSLISNTFQLLSLPKLFFDFYHSHSWKWRKKDKSRLNFADLFKKTAFYSGKI